MTSQTRLTRTMQRAGVETRLLLTQALKKITPDRIRTARRAKGQRAEDMPRTHQSISP
jgi:hypothetical protein